MSFILDALRKSEHERQRQRRPGIAEVHTAQRKNNRSVWKPLVALLAGLNIGLLALLWFSGNDDAPTTETTPPARATNRVATDAPAPSWADESRASGGLADELETATEPARYASVAPSTKTTPPSTATPTTPVARKPKPSSKQMRTVTEGIMDGSLNIPLPHLDIHVYSAVPSERFVFIDSRRYSEGERVTDDIQISAINEQGVVLRYQGRDYLLTRD